MPVWTALVEYFLLHRTESTVATLSADTQRRGRSHLLLARQKRFAADTLWNHHQRAEALSLLRDAFEESLRAATTVYGAAWPSALASLGASPEAIDTVTMLQNTLQGEALPAFDAQVSPALEARREELVGALTALDRALAPVLTSRDERRAIRRMRVGFLFVSCMAVATVVLRARLSAHPAVLASAYLTTTPGFPPSKAVDGDPVTEWILPLGTAGWIDVYFERPRTITAVRLLNAHNRTHNDLATRDYRIEVYASNRLAGTAQGSFAGISPTGTWARHPIAARGVTRVRVWIDTFHGAAGGLGEIVVE